MLQAWGQHHPLPIFGSVREVPDFFHKFDNDPDALDALQGPRPRPQAPRHNAWPHARAPRHHRRGN